MLSCPGFRAPCHPTPLLALLFLAALALPACAPLDPLATGDPGRLVIVGGALQADNDPVYQAILEGLDGPGALCVIPTASGVPRESMESAVERFRNRVPDREVRGVLLTVDNAADAHTAVLADALRACSGFFFTGGSQSRILDVFRPGGENTAAYDALMDRWRAGAVVAGTSAGAAMMSRRSINGGSSAGALRHGLRDGEDGDGVWVRRGMEFTADLVVDQHFLARGRWGRLAVTLLADPEASAGAGIDENTALVVEGGTGRVAGASGVVWMRPGAEPDVLRVDLLGRGDRIDLATGMTTRARNRTPLELTAGGGFGAAGAPGGGATEAAPDRTGSDPFQRWALLHLLEAFGRSADTTLRLEGGDESGGAILTLEKAPGFSATRSPGDGVQGAAPGLSVGPLYLRVDAAGVR